MRKISKLLMILLLLAVGIWYLHYRLELLTYNQELLISDEKAFQGTAYYTSALIPAGTYRVKIDTSGSVDNVRILDESGGVLYEPLIAVRSDFIYTSKVPFKVDVKFSPGSGYNKYTVLVRIYKLTRK